MNEQNIEMKKEKIVSEHRKKTEKRRGAKSRGSNLGCSVSLVPMENLQ